MMLMTNIMIKKKTLAGEIIIATTKVITKILTVMITVMIMIMSYHAK